MGKVKKVIVQLPNKLIEEVDSFVNNSDDRNDFIKEATKLYLYEKKRQQIRENLRSGYIEMSDINLQLADEGLNCEAKTIFYYEERLAKCD